jgi:hypothetical protein
MLKKDRDLIVKHGLIVFNTATFTELPECDLDFCANFQDEINEVCKNIVWDSDRDRILVMKPDRTKCYCRCR